MDALKNCKILCDMLYPVERHVVSRSLIRLRRAGNDALRLLARFASQNRLRRHAAGVDFSVRIPSTIDSVRGKIASVVVVCPSDRRKGTQRILLEDHERIGAR